MPHAARVSGFEENLDHPVVDDDGNNEEKEEDDNDGDEVPDAAGGGCHPNIAASWMFNVSILYVEFKPKLKMWKAGWSDW